MDDRDRQTDTDDDIARLLRAAGPREQLAPDMKQRWEQQFSAALQPVLARRQRRRRRQLVGLCASLVLLVGAALLTLTPGSPSPPVIVVTYASADTRALPAGQEPQALHPGQQLAVGTVLSTGGSGYLGLRLADYDLRINHGSRLRLQDDGVALLAGEIYASDNDVGDDKQPLRVATAHGVIRDIGTQFTVATYPERTVATVRRGAVVIDTGREELRAEALPGTASRLTIDAEQQVLREAVPPNGQAWSWIYPGSTGFSLEGKSAHDFLLWSVGESGLQLEFATEGARIRAHTTRLHGDISGLDPEQAVDPVLASTDLLAERVAATTLRISLRP